MSVVGVAGVRDGDEQGAPVAARPDPGLERARSRLEAGGVGQDEACCPAVERGLEGGQRVAPPRR